MSTLFSTYNESHVALLARVKVNLPQLEGLQREMAEREAVGLLSFFRSALLQAVS